MALVSAKEMVDKAHEGHYAIPAFNINDLEWTKSVLAGIQQANSPAILQVSEGAGKYMATEQYQQSQSLLSSHS